MCGIYCSMPVPQNGHDAPVTIEAKLKNLLERRGPDASKIISIDGITFGGFVLQQQGENLCTQPFDSGDIILLLNGDIFGGTQTDLKKYMSDTAWLGNTLAQCYNDADYCAVLQRMEGPYAIIFYNKRTKDIYFARDSLGRNSLLIERQDNCFRLLSTSYFTESNRTEFIMEVPPCGLYKINGLKPLDCVIYPWTEHYAQYYASQMECLAKSFGALEIRECIYPLWLNIERPVSNLLFDFYKLCKQLTLEGISVCDLMDHLRLSTAVEKALSEFSLLLEHSVRDRVQKTTKFCNLCKANSRQKCFHAKVAILFSGGIDCTILACLANKFVPVNDPIDLINVAFESVDSSKNLGNKQWLVPDRLTAENSLAELQRLCPNRKWQLIEVNVTRKLLHETLVSHIQHLIYPLNTVLDESIGACFWHAANGRGDTTARVVIVGSGADELFGGYQRHRRAFERCAGDLLDKQRSVSMELDKDWLRIASRNLARDDRVVADSSKTLRAPFIEENVVKFINGNLHPNQRCCFLLGEGLGDKLFLRLYGYQLGLRSSVHLKKRAIQFGSKIANKKQNANDRSIYLNFID